MDMLSSELVPWGTPNCGKGQPGQTGHTGHPAAPSAVPQRAGGGAGMNQVELAARAVELVTARLAGADVIAEVDRHEHALTRFATSVIHQNVAEDTTTVRLDVHHDGRTTAGSGTVIDAAALDDLVARVVDSAAIAPRDPALAGAGGSCARPRTSREWTWRPPAPRRRTGPRS